MLVADASRAVTLVAGILFVAAISYDRYIHVEYTDNSDEQIHVGVYKMSVDDLPPGDPTPSASCTSDPDGDSLSQACENSCKSKKAFTVMLAILPFVAVAVSSLMSNPLMSTSNRVMLIISGLITQFTAVLSVVLIMFFVVEMRIPGGVFDNALVCATYVSTDTGNVSVYTSLILTMIGGALCAISGTMQLVMPSIKIPTANHMLYNNMLYNRMSGHM